jgi:hypothetical protein
VKGLDSFVTLARDRHQAIGRASCAAWSGGHSPRRTARPTPTRARGRVTAPTTRTESGADRIRAWRSDPPPRGHRCGPQTRGRHGHGAVVRRGLHPHGCGTATCVTTRRRSPGCATAIVCRPASALSDRRIAAHKAYNGRRQRCAASSNVTCPVIPVSWSTPAFQAWGPHDPCACVPRCRRPRLPTGGGPARGPLGHCNRPISLCRPPQPALRTLRHCMTA